MPAFPRFRAALARTTHSAKKRRARGRSGRTVRIEHLEDRRLLSAATPDATLAQGDPALAYTNGFIDYAIPHLLGEQAIDYINLNPVSEWVDFDADGDLDLNIIGSFSFDSGGSQTDNRLYKSNGTTGLLSEFTPTVLNGDHIFGAGVYAIVDWGDFDNDNDMDFFMGGYGWGMSQYYSETGRLYRNEGDGNFTIMATGMDSVYRGEAQWADFDRDGDLDLATIGTAIYDDHPARVYRNEGSGLFVPVYEFPELENGSLDWGDIDNDGDLDLLVTGNQGFDELTLLVKYEGGVFVQVASHGLPNVSQSDADFGDFDNDGDLDLVIAGRDIDSDRHLDVYRNDGTGRFTLHHSASPMENGFLQWCDIDADGDLDVFACGNVAGRAIKLVNQGGYFFEVVEDTVNPTSYGRGAVGDYNNDGRLDLVAVGSPYGLGEGRVIHKSNYQNANTAPGAPSHLLCTPTATSGKVTLSWDAAVDAQTPSDGLSYNLRIGTTPGGHDVWSPAADTATGKRYIAERGSIQGTSVDVAGLTPGVTYYWSVQAIDHAFEGGAFAVEGSFDPATGTIIPGPSIESLSPADDATDVSPDALLTVTFSEAVERGTGLLTIRRQADDSIFYQTTPFSGDTRGWGTTSITVDPYLTMEESTGYYVEMADGFARSVDGDNAEGTSDSETWNFVTGASPVEVLGFSPNDNAPDVGVNDSLHVFFDGAVERGSGLFTIRRGADDSIFYQTSPLGGRVTGWGTSQLTIDPAIGFQFGQSYYVQFDTGFAVGANGLGVAGISDSTEWNFTTTIGTTTLDVRVVEDLVGNGVDATDSAVPGLTVEVSGDRNGDGILDAFVLSSGDAPVPVAPGLYTFNLALSGWAVSESPSPLEVLPSRNTTAQMAIEPTTLVVEESSDAFRGDGLLGLREAIIAANAKAGPDTIEVHASLAGETIALDPALGELLLCSEIDLISLGGAPVVIDAQGTARALRIASAGEVEIQGFTITRGDSDVGGGISIDDATARLRGVAFIENMAAYGGAIYAGQGAQVFLENPLFRANEATASGGAVFATGEGTVVEITGQSAYMPAELVDNTATVYGGAVLAVDGAHVKLTEAHLSAPGVPGNAAVGGGALAAYRGGRLEVVRTTITGHAAAVGGAIYVGAAGSMLTVCDPTPSSSGSDIASNRAEIGGGLYVARGGEAVISSAAFDENEAESRGGAIAAVGTDSRITLSDVDLTGNRATALGGGIYVANGAEIDVTDGLISGTGLPAGGLSAYLGGGLAVERGGVASLTRTTITAGRAQYGGGFFVRGPGSTVSLTDTTITGNTAQRLGHQAFRDALARVYADLAAAVDDGSGDNGSGDIFGNITRSAPAALVAYDRGDSRDSDNEDAEREPLDAATLDMIYAAA